MKLFKYILFVFFSVNFVLSAQVNSTDFIQITGGSFTFGNSVYSRESPTKLIYISAFYMTTKVISNAQFAGFINNYGSVTVKDGEYAGKPMFISDSWGIVENNGVWSAAAGYDNFPMIKVTWYGANEFCKYYGGRLPTEAEWEYAAKGGKTQIAYTYSGSSNATTVAWYYDNSGHVNHAVGTKAANTTGLYDMSGNVYQWCSDWFGRYNEFGTSGDIDPQGPENGVSKVIRGGYRSLGATDLHLTHRENISPDECYNFVGFRMVKDDLSSGIYNPESGICVYPNPAGKFVCIDSDSKIEKLEIIDSQGKILLSTTDCESKINLKNYCSGMYILNIKLPEKTVVQKLLIKK